MASIELIKASDGSGNANVATVQSSRAPLASTIVVDTVLGINGAGFAGTMGTPHTFTDPVTSETITVISEATAVDFTGHVDGSNLEIDDIAPGYTDLGSEVGDIIVIRPTTQYADNLADVVAESHNDDGTIKDGAISDEDMLADNVIVSEAPFADAVDPVKRTNEYGFDYIASGCVWTADAAGSTRLASCTSGVVYIAGKRLTVAAVTGRTFTASKDVYCDLVDAGNGTATWVYYDNTLSAASPSFATTGGTMRGAIVVVGASSIAAATSINQGQESYAPYQVCDSLGNLICPRDPQHRMLGIRNQTGGAFATASTSPVAITGTSVPIAGPVGRKIRVTVLGNQMYNSGSGQTTVGIFTGATSAALTTQFGVGVTLGAGTAAETYVPLAVGVLTLTAALQFITASLNVASTGTSTLGSCIVIIELM